MVTIAIVVGIKTDAISEYRYPEWLTDIPQSLVSKSRESWGNGEYGLGSDVGVAYYIQKFSKHQVDILTAKDISLQTFNKYDYVIGLYDPYYHANLTKKSSNYKKYNDIIKKTSATFLQPQPFQRFVLDKKRHITELQKNNLPVVDTKSFPITSKMNPQTMIQKISLYCDEWDTDYFITKPQPGGFGIGFKKWDINKLLQNSKPFIPYISKIKNQVLIEKPLLLVQNYVPEFEKFYEVRTYWLNGTYSHSLGTIIDPSSLGTEGFEKVIFAYPENEYDKDEFSTYDELPKVLDQSLVNSLKKIARKVIQVIPTDSTGIPYLIRIDFGCCLDNKNICRDYFINEIEYLPNIFPEYNTHIDVLQKVGNAILTKINKLDKQKKSPKKK